MLCLRNSGRDGGDGSSLLHDGGVAGVVPLGLNVWSFGSDCWVSSSILLPLVPAGSGTSMETSSLTLAWWRGLSQLGLAVYLSVCLSFSGVPSTWSHRTGWSQECQTSYTEGGCPQAKHLKRTGWKLFVNEQCKALNCTSTSFYSPSESLMPDHIQGEGRLDATS